MVYIETVITRTWAFERYLMLLVVWYIERSMVHHETERAKSMYGLRCINGLVRIVQPISLHYDGLEG